MHSIISLYTEWLRPESDYPHLFLNTLATPLGEGEASRYLTKYFKPWGLDISGVTLLRKVLSNTYCNAANIGIISPSGICQFVY
jgi:hypothetical protein